MRRTRPACNSTSQRRTPSWTTSNRAAWTALACGRTPQMSKGTWPSCMWRTECTVGIRLGALCLLSTFYRRSIDVLSTFYAHSLALLLQGRGCTSEVYRFQPSRSSRCTWTMGTLDRRSSVALGTCQSGCTCCCSGCCTSCFRRWKLGIGAVWSRQPAFPGYVWTPMPSRLGRLQGPAAAWCTR